jgi:acetyl-CoA C-acetyltransferase
MRKLCGGCLTNKLALNFADLTDSKGILQPHQKDIVMTQAYIYDAVRTARGRAKDTGALHALTPLDLMATLYKALEQRTGLDPTLVEDVILGCATQVGEQAANIAKTSTLYAGWPSSIPGITINRYCSSGIDAAIFAAMKVSTGMASCVVAGGVEMMSRVGMLSDKPNAFTDPALSSKLGMLMMGNGADLIASLDNISREQVDAVALKSQQRAHFARENGYYKSIVPVFNSTLDKWVSEDEIIRANTTAQSLADMQCAFDEVGKLGTDKAQLSAHSQLSHINHVHTAGNSPAMADGAAAILIGDKSLESHLHVKPRARIVSMITVNDDMTTVIGGCLAATKALLKKANLTPNDIDLFEIHEAFAATMVKTEQDLNIGDEKLNVNGGCIALGHPLGATGSIMIGILLDELERRDLLTGIVAASGAAGAGSAILISRDMGGE